MQSQTDLKQKLENISKVFKIEDVLSIKTSNEYTQKYYQVNKIPYSLFHTKTDLIYMGVSRDGIYKEKDLLEAAKTVEKYLKNLNGNKVLELATGRGANSFYLAQKFPAAKFYGVDISRGQLDFAFKKAKGINNYFPNFGDYHDLSKFESGTFDIVFVVEALCYSMDNDKVLAEVYRVLKKNGVFIIFDGYLNKKINQLTSDEKIASGLTEKGMAVEKFELYDSLISKAKENNFKIEFEENVSQFVIPTMERFERKAALFFKFPKLAKLSLYVFPKEFLYNAISGYLSATLMKINVCSYMITVLKKDNFLNND
ncbi:class I SAM-dependent methyltransferase [Patescibacteria group bacterium]|nr:class I SAM-dependent methyltransferase [Patescibacteria group bacterium]MBU4141580.1 class I SAM-dependent methyltransferase [Patescibacteria group bacterium]MBU4338093.1 class I SAM-dependent methyltransferase [Patescibacteria group bacterium]MBU4579789.1 class I SAM-dependent methyltransferase [Patescibacteria group bacterium]